MHEYSVIQALMDQIEILVQENKAERVSKVIVKIGVMSGIEPHLLESAFNTFKEETVCKEAQFVMQIQPLVIHCNDCQKRSELESIHYRCLACESTDVDVIDGEDMFLMRLEMQVATIL